MITSVLVANRGEIACRVFRTCRDLGVRTVAVYSDADANALHTRVADTAVRLPGAAPSETYLDGALIVKAALDAGADAVHPGYGFLSENAGFARAVLDAGLVWIGPPPEAIEAMASKTRAKELMGLAPLGEVTAADLPVLVKAAAGGGGRGMRIVRRLDEFDAALASAASNSSRPARPAPARRPRAPSVTARCSSSRTSSAAAMSRCRSSPTPMARCGRSAPGTARCSAGTRR